MESPSPIAYPVYTGDFLPYADNADSYWTGNHVVLCLSNFFSFKKFENKNLCCLFFCAPGYYTSRAQLKTTVWRTAALVRSSDVAMALAVGGENNNNNVEIMTLFV